MVTDGTAERHRGPAREVVHRLRPRTTRLARSRRHLVEHFEDEVPNAVVQCAVYDKNGRMDGNPSPMEALAIARESPDRFCWVGLYEPTAQEFATIATEFGLHPLAVEDAVQAHQRPKLDRYGERLFFVLKSARYCEHEQITANTEVVETGEVMLFVAPDFVVSVRHGSARPLDVVRHRLDTEPDLCCQGPPGVLYAVADQVVDDYELVSEALQTDLDEIESRVFAGTRGYDTQNVYQLKREVSEFKRAVLPLVRPLHQLVQGEIPGINEQVSTYLSDVLDHLMRTVEEVGASDELLSSILQANLAQIALQQNDDMRKMSAWLAIIAVPTAVTGFFGQNIPYPGFNAHSGFWASTIIIAGGAAFLYIVFKRKRWL